MGLFVEAKLVTKDSYHSPVYRLGSELFSWFDNYAACAGCDRVYGTPHLEQEAHCYSSKYSDDTFIVRGARTTLQYWYCPTCGIYLMRRAETHYTQFDEH